MLADGAALAPHSRGPAVQLCPGGALLLATPPSAVPPPAAAAWTRAHGLPGRELPSCVARAAPPEPAKELCAGCHLLEVLRAGDCLHSGAHLINMRLSSEATFLWGFQVFTLPHERLLQNHRPARG